MAGENIGNTPQQIAEELKRVRGAVGLSQEQMAARLGMDHASNGRKVSTGRAIVSMWERGRRAPLPKYLRAYIDLGGDPVILTPQAASPLGEGPTEIPSSFHAAGFSAEDRPDLLLRVYVPAQRLYAGETRRLLGLFRDWLADTRRSGIQQSGYRTAAGEMFEFFAQDSIPQSSLREEFNAFSHFLETCADSPTAATEALGGTEIENARRAELVARFGKEFRRLQVDMHHERERRIMTLRHTLEAELLENGVSLLGVSGTQIDALLEDLVPGLQADTSLLPIASPGAPGQSPPVSITVNHQVVNAMEYTVIHSIHGTVHLGTQAKAILELIDRHSGQDAETLRTALHELEDPDAPTPARSAAKRKLMKFLAQLAGKAEDLSLAILEKYIESKLGI